MTHTNMSLSTIARFWCDEKPLYLEIEEDGKPRRLRIRGCRLAKGGKLEVKVSRDGQSPKWENADRCNIVCAY